MRKSYIKEAQKRLKSLGYMISADGIWGNNSKKALQDFQNSNNLRADGILGRNTKKELFKTDKNNTIDLIKAQCAVLQITKPEQIQYIIATALHETGGTLKATKEKGGNKYLSSLYDPILAKSKRLRDRAKSMGNTEEGDGIKYCGRGLVQLTWKSNYAKYGEIMGIDLVNNPNLALDMKHAVFILVHGMKYGTFTGKKLDDYINGNGTNFLLARKIINGGDKANKIALLACVS